MAVLSLAEATGLLARSQTTPQTLAEIAAAYPELRTAVAAHPNVSPALQAWIAQRPPLEATTEAPVQVPVDAQPFAGSPPVGPAPAPARSRGSRAPWVVTGVAVIVAVAALVALVLRAPAAPPAAPTAGGLGVAAATTRTGAAQTASSPDVEQAAAGERGFATPEQAVKYVIERMAAGDFARASEAFAVGHLVAGYSFRAQAERMSAIVPFAWLPATSDGFRAIDTDLRRGEVARQLQVFVQSALAPQYDFTVSHRSDSATIAAFESALAPEGLAAISLVRVDALLPMAGTRYATNIAKQFAYYGPDETRDTTYLLRTSQGTAMGGMAVLRYGTSWFAYSMGSPLAGISAGQIKPTSEQEYLTQLAELRAVVND